jgi:hypothetical protein
MAWYSELEYEQYAFLNRATGPYWWAYWSMMTCNVFSPQFMWFKKLKQVLCFLLSSIVVNIGMWFERFVIIVTSLEITCHLHGQCFRQHLLTLDFHRNNRILWFFIVCENFPSDSSSRG